MTPSPVFLPGKSHGQMSLVGYSLWGHKESDTAEHACTHTHHWWKKNQNCSNMLWRARINETQISVSRNEVVLEHSRAQSHACGCFHAGEWCSAFQPKSPGATFWEVDVAVFQHNFFLDLHSSPTSAWTKVHRCKARIQLLSHLSLIIRQERVNTGSHRQEEMPWTGISCPGLSVKGACRRVCSTTHLQGDSWGHNFPHQVSKEK